MGFDLEHWSELQSLFHLAGETPEADRERVLGSACGNPAVLRRALEILSAAESQPAAKPAPRTIGPYTLIRHLGTGGTGAVYLAERMAGSVMRQSAVKVLAPHAAGQQFIERFQREQRILASLEHPHITRMLDAGLTDSGQPYLVMEYVEGVHLDRYCDARKLDVPARLRLFLDICEAVDYAHRNLVVHLDLKPSNILVTADGSVKLLDFGTSKLLHPDGLQSATLMATPAYSSPEQLRNQPVTTACDVYSLGVILFELVAGRRPAGEGSALAWMDENSQLREPERPDQVVTGEAAENRATTGQRLRALLSGDLSTAIRKCLMPRPEDRYASVRALSDDITRYLEGRPILARPQTTLYQLGKFVRRNRGRVSLALLLTVALVGSLFYAWQGQRRALKEAHRAVVMQTMMYRLFKSASPIGTGKPETTVKQLLESGAEMLPQYLHDPEDLRKAQLGIARSLYDNDDYGPATKLYQEAMASAKSSGDVAGETDALSHLSSIAFMTGRAAEARDQISRALDLAGNPRVPMDVRFLTVQKYVWVQSESAVPMTRLLALLSDAIRDARQSNVDPPEIAEALNWMGGTLQNMGRLDESERAYTEALAIFARYPDSECAAAVTKSGLGGLRRNQNRPAEAAELFRQSYATELKCWGPAPFPRLQEVWMADAMVASGRVHEALPILEQAEPLWRKPPVTPSLTFSALKYLGYAYLETGRYQDAERVLRDDLATYGKDIPPWRASGVHLLLARALNGQGRFKDALPEAEIADRLISQSSKTPLSLSNGKIAHALAADLRAKMAGGR